MWSWKGTGLKLYCAHKVLYTKVQKLTLTFNPMTPNWWGPSSHRQQLTCEVWKWSGINCSLYRAHKAKHDGRTHALAHPTTHKQPHYYITSNAVVYILFSDLKSCVLTAILNMTFGNDRNARDNMVRSKTLMWRRRVIPLDCWHPAKAGLFFSSWITLANHHKTLPRTPNHTCWMENIKIHKWYLNILQKTLINEALLLKQELKPWH